MMKRWGRRAEDQEWFIRLNRSEVWQHNIIWVTFAALVVTGMMSLIPTTWVIAMFGNSTAVVYRWRRYLHFAFAAGLFIGCVWHVLYLALTEDGRQVFWSILLKPIDFIQMKENVLYMLDIKKEQPRFDRFDYKEKLEYLFGCIGTVVIFITGTIMTFESKFPKFAVEVAATFHLMEATLASFAISIWHFYAVHLKPGKFPQDTSWIDGKMSLHHLKEEHPLFYERVVREREMQKPKQKREEFVLPVKEPLGVGTSDAYDAGAMEEEEEIDEDEREERIL